MSNKSRKQILDRIRKATQHTSRLPDPPEDTDQIMENKRLQHMPITFNGLIEQFERELIELSAEFYQVSTVQEITEKIHEIMKTMAYEKLVYTEDQDCTSIIEDLGNKEDSLQFISATKIEYPDRKYKLAEVSAGLVKASFAVADIGSLVFPYDENGTSLAHFLPDCIFALVNKNSLVADQFELVKHLDPQKAKNMVFIAGPSRTADIEKVLVLGAHGPRRLIVFMTDF